MFGEAPAGSRGVRTTEESSPRQRKSGQERQLAFVVILFIRIQQNIRFP